MKPKLALFATYSYHGFITDRDGEMLELEADHRRHAEIENAIRDLKYGVGLNHMPSGRFAANGAWLAVQVMAHNLARWTARIGLGERIATTKTLRRRFFALVGRITRSARRLTLAFLGNPVHSPGHKEALFATGSFHLLNGAQPSPLSSLTHPAAILTIGVLRWIRDKEGALLKVTPYAVKPSPAGRVIPPIPSGAG